MEADFSEMRAHASCNWSFSPVSMPVLLMHDLHHLYYHVYESYTTKDF